MAEEEENVAENTEAKEPSKKASVPWIPLVLVLLFIPIITLVLVDLVVVPKLRNSLTQQHSESDSGEHAEATHEPEAKDGGHGGGHGGGEDTVASRGNSYTFEDIISNVSGTMGTRFLKVSFQVVGEGDGFASRIKNKEPQVRDAIISTLSSKTINDIEAVGGRNSIRIALISAINGALGETLVVELFFIEFIIQ